MYVQPMARPPSHRAASAESPPPPTLLSRSQSTSRKTVAKTESCPPLMTPPPLPSRRHSGPGHTRRPSPGEATSRRSRDSASTSSHARIKGAGSSKSLPVRQSSRKTKSKTSNTTSSPLQPSPARHRPSSRRASDTDGGAKAVAPENQPRGCVTNSTGLLPHHGSPLVSGREAPPSPGSDSTPKRRNATRSGDDCQSLPADYIVKLDDNAGVTSSRSSRVGSVHVSQPRRKSFSHKSSSSSRGVTPPATSNGTRRKTDLDALRRASLSGTLPRGPPKSSFFLENLPSYSRRKSNTANRFLHSNVQAKTKRSHALNEHKDNGEVVPAVYQHAQQQEWNEMMDACRLLPESASYVNRADGTTALHLAVMSRTGYSPPVSPNQQQTQEEENREHDASQPLPASLEDIEELIQLCPNASKVVCTLYSYTPLAYACLVSGDEWNLEDSAAMVRLFLKHAPDCLSVFTEGGLSALDVHIISFSYKNREQQVEDSILSGRTSTVVLRTLLEADPCLAHVRIRKDKVGGPIELLYRCNSGAFLDAVDLDDFSYMKKKSTSDPNDKSVIATITNWWVWKWTILLLKYGTVPYKKKGAPFLAVQAAAAMVGCPLPVLALALKAFPKQVRQRDVMQGVKGNLPLHEVASWPCQQDSESTEPVISSRKGMAISALLQEYPGASKIRNNLNQTPLELAVATGTTWDCGVRKLVRLNPDAVTHASPLSRLVPFLSAASAAAPPAASREEAQKQHLERESSSRRSLASYQTAIAKRDLQSIRTIYGLLRADPTVLTELISSESSFDANQKKSTRS